MRDTTSIVVTKYSIYCLFLSVCLHQNRLSVSNSSCTSFVLLIAYQRLSNCRSKRHMLQYRCLFVVYGDRYVPPRSHSSIAHITSPNRFQSDDRIQSLNIQSSSDLERRTIFRLFVQFVTGRLRLSMLIASSVGYVLSRGKHVYREHRNFGDARGCQADNCWHASPASIYGHHLHRRAAGTRARQVCPGSGQRGGARRGEGNKGDYKWLAHYTGLLVPQLSGYAEITR